MDESARRALRDIQKCVEQDRVIVLAHFVERMDSRGLFWADILEVIDSPKDVRAGGYEELGRPKWILTGHPARVPKIEIVCILDRDESGISTVFVTIYWQE